MKLVKEHINEKFEEESDPIKDMGIGTIKYFYDNMKPGDIFRFKKSIPDHYIKNV